MRAAERVSPLFRFGNMLCKQLTGQLVLVPSKPLLLLSNRKSNSTVWQLSQLLVEGCLCRVIKEVQYGCSVANNITNALYVCGSRLRRSHRKSEAHSILSGSLNDGDVLSRMGKSKQRKPHVSLTPPQQDLPKFHLVREEDTRQ